MNTKSATDAVKSHQIRLAALEIDGWHLLSGFAQHLDTPDTFYLPPAHERSNLEAGDNVKLMFDMVVSPPGELQHTFSERMWVKVCDRSGIYYVGELNDFPVCSHVQDHLGTGDTVIFLPEHVIEILDEEAMIERIEQHHRLHKPPAKS